MNSISTTRRYFLAATAALSAAALVPNLACAQNATDKPVSKPNSPNILYVTADDLGEQVGCYGDAIARTPNIDALAATGTRFANAYVTQASCSPSRSTLLTGLYPHQNGQVGLANRGYSMKEGIPNLPTLLHDSGYRTGIIGKLHVNQEADFKFDYERKNAHSTLDVRNVAKQAREFVDSAKDEPFFLYLNYFDPHVPFQQQVKGLPENPFKAEDVKPLPFNDINSQEALQSIADFYNGATRLDAGFGMILEMLKETGHDKDTIIVFIGDHGAPFPRGKTTCYEGGVRVPFIVKMPGQTKAQTVEAMVSSADIVPTLLQAAKVDKKIETAGEPLQPLLADLKRAGRKTLVTEYFAHTAQAYYPRRSIRDGRYKLIVNLLAPAPNPVATVDGTTGRPKSAEFVDERAYRAYKTLLNPPTEELYDLKNDPNEWNNLAGRDLPALQKKQDELRAALREWQEKTDDPLRDPGMVVQATSENAEQQRKDVEARKSKEKSAKEED